MRADQAVVEILKREGVTTLFCFPTTPIIEAAVAVGIRPIICRQERVGVDMADGFARVTNGRPPGVFAMQYGPGAENAFPGIATTFSDSVPVLFLPLGHPREPGAALPDVQCPAAPMPRSPSRSRKCTAGRDRQHHAARLQRS